MNTVTHIIQHSVSAMRKPSLAMRNSLNKLTDSCSTACAVSVHATIVNEATETINYPVEIMLLAAMSLCSTLADERLQAMWAQLEIINIFK